MTSLRKPREFSSSPRMNDFTASLGSSRSVGESPKSSAWDLKLNFAQVMVIWAVLGGIMLAVFLFGLYAGREQGIRLALEQHSGETVRLPVASPVAVTDASGLAPITPGASAALLTQEADTAPLAVMRTGSDAGKEASKIDFSAQAKLAPADPEQGLGLASRPTMEIFRDDIAPRVAKTEVAAGAKDEKSLAARAAMKTERPAPASEKSTPAATAQKGAEQISTAKAVTPPPTQSKATVAPAATQKVAPGWYVQVAAARSNDDASRMVKKLQQKGLSARVEAAKVSRGTYYRVIVGPYPSRDAATAGRRSVVAAKVAKGDPFLRQIK